MRKCAKCHKEIEGDEKDFRKMKNCPHCGADLRSFVKKHPIATALIFTFFIIFIVSNLEKSGKQSEQAVKQLDSITQMQLAFNGDYSREQIQERVVKAMSLYGLPITEENLGRAGSVLVSLRQNNGVDEMDILEYMIESYVPNVKLSFGEEAAMAAVFIQTGNR